MVENIQMEVVPHWCDLWNWIFCFVA